MKYKTLCRLLLRLLGVFFIGLAINSFCEAGGGVIVNFLRNTTRDWSELVYPVLQSCGGLGVGLYLFFGGGWILNRMIPSNRPYCHECGYDLTGSVGNICAECGTPFKIAAVTEPDH